MLVGAVVRQHHAVRHVFIHLYKLYVYIFMAVISPFAGNESAASSDVLPGTL